jgi:hypothetical protein
MPWLAELKIKIMSIKNIRLEVMQLLEKKWILYERLLDSC